jgi:hypothetical protein
MEATCSSELLMLIYSDPHRAMEWIKLALDRNQWWAFVKRQLTVVPYEAEMS